MRNLQRGMSGAIPGLGDVWTDIFSKQSLSAAQNRQDQDDRLNALLLQASDAATYREFARAYQVLYSPDVRDLAAATGRQADVARTQQVVVRAQAEVAATEAQERRIQGCETAGGTWSGAACDMSAMIESQKDQNAHIEAMAGMEMQQAMMCMKNGGSWNNGKCKAPKGADPNFALVATAFAPHLLFRKKSKGMADFAPGLGAIPGLPGVEINPNTGRPTTGSAGKQIALGAVTGLATGAAVGAVGGPIGAVIGGAIGLVVGSVPGIISMVEAKGGGSTHVERMGKFNAAIVSAANANLPTAVAAIQAATAEINRFQALAERAAPSSDPGIASAVAAAVPANQALSAAGNELVVDVNTYTEGKDSINPWNLKGTPLLALQAIPADVAATNRALGPAQMANSILERALLAGGA